MCRILVGVLIFFLAGLVLERQIASEYIAFLERDIRIEQTYRNLKEGMTAAEVMNLIVLPPDTVYEKEGGAGITGRIWSVKEHVGPIHRFFGIEARDEKSYMKLAVEFDRNMRLIEISYRG
jgi:hypothetical protein